MIKYFVFNGKDSRDFNILIKGANRYSAPERDIETIEIPGRDGALYIDNGSYKARKIEIECYIRNDLRKYAELINSWLYSSFKMAKLMFSDDLDYFYTGTCISKIDIDESERNFNKFKLIFDCMPYRYLAEGEQKITINKNNSSLFNLTNFSSKPYIKIIGTGDISLSINNKTYVFNAIDSFIEVDSEELNCYKNVNGVITYQNNKFRGTTFPALDPGINNISWVGNITSIEIIPRWCEL